MLDVQVSGGPSERGQQYGARAARLIAQSVAIYARTFDHLAGVSWDHARRDARKFLPQIREFAPAAVAEMEGMAAGANLEFEDVLTLNCRSELMFGLYAGARATADPGECSSFAVLPSETADGHTLVGQNWDWRDSGRPTTVRLKVTRDDGPDYMTIVEAGLLAKTGMNSAGLGMCTNTLVVEQVNLKGIPYHLILRSLLDAVSISDAVSTVVSADKAFSANYLVGHTDGVAADIETVPGSGIASARVILPTDGILTHTNHFTDDRFAQLDTGIGAKPGTLFRLHNLRTSMDQARGNLSPSEMETVLSDHRNYPGSVCVHPDTKVEEILRSATLASVIYDVTNGNIRVTGDSPCLGGYQDDHIPITDNRRP